MIKNILDCLSLVEDTDVEIIKVAKGKYKFPETFKGLKSALKTIKNK
tara:strand:+ start:618 stop:758 length:141 start_codon:yes stop_codon:yes gene_type:complete